MPSPARDLNWHRFANILEADSALALAVSGNLMAAYEQRQSAILSLSGGRSPLGFMKELSFSLAPWRDTTILLVDDRQTDKWATPRSNAGLIQSAFRDTPASMATFVPLVPEGAKVSVLEDGLSPELSTALKQGSDALVLGMGMDGHFASLFPEADQLEQAFDLKAKPGAMAITAPGADEPRATQNFAAINAAKHLYLQLPNTEKRTFFEAIEEGAHPETPMARLLATKGPALNIFTVDL